MDDRSLQEHGGERLTLLCVEDDPVSVLLIRRLLEQVIATVIIASDGREGLRSFNECAPDIILTDQIMPGMSGLEMIREIRLSNSHVPVVLMTSLIDEDVLIEAINLGVSKFVPKPVRPSILNKALMEVKQELRASQLLEQTRRQELELLRYRDRYHSRQQEMAFRKERHIIRNDLLRRAFSGRDEERWGVDVIYRPQDIMCGDSYAARSLEDGRLLLFLADAMGAGLSASITSMLATSHFNYLVDHPLRGCLFGLEPLMQHMRAYLRGILLDDEMLCMGIYLIDLKEESMEGVLFGLPPLLVKHRDGGVQTVRSGNPPLTLYEGETVVTRLPLRDIVSLTMTSDGLGEAGMGGDGSFRDVMLDEFRQAPTAAALMRRFDRMANSGQDDLVLLHLQRLSAPAAWQWQETVSDPTLGRVSALAGRCLDELGRVHPLEDRERTELEVILTEALTNAFEHGCLRLDQEEKDKLIADGEYDEFVALSAQGSGAISLALSLRGTPRNHLLTVEVADSGAGFDPDTAGNPDILGFSGRGLRLIAKYADAMYVSPPGNRMHILKTVEVSNHAD